MAVKKTKAAGKEKGKKNSILPLIIKYGVISAVVTFFAFAIYLVAAALSVAAYKPFPGTNISSDRIPVNEDQVKILVSNSEKGNIEKALTRLFRNAETFLLIDISDFPALFYKDEKKKENFFYRALIDAKNAKPGLYTLIITDSKELYSTEKYRKLYSELLTLGIDIVFTERDAQRDYRWIYGPAGRFAVKLIDLLPEHNWFTAPRFSKSMADGTKIKISCREQLKVWQGKKSARNIIIAKTSSGFEAITGTLSPNAPPDDLQIATFLKGEPVMPLLKSELFIAREFLSKKGNGLSTDGETSILRHVELVMKDIHEGQASGSSRLWMEFLTEEAVGIKMEWMLAGISGGDSIDIIAGALNDHEIIKLINAANSKKCGIRIIFGKNRNLFSQPEDPNFLSAEELYLDNKNTSKDMEIRWLEGCSTKVSLLHIFNNETGSSKILLCSSGTSFKSLRGYNLASAIYVEGDFSGSKKLEDVFNFYWKSQDKNFYTSDYTKYAPGYFRSLYHKIIFALKTWSGYSHEVEN